MPLLLKNDLSGLIYFGALMISSSNGLADENSIQLKEGSGVNDVVAQCAVCHSLDYIQMNAMILDRTGWERTINKMILLGASISNTDKTVLLDYLSKQYGK